MKKLLIIEGDWNDADYVTSINEVTDKQLKELIPIFNKMKKDKKSKKFTRDWEDNYPSLTEEELNILDDYIPTGYEQDCHTIVSITIYDINSKKSY